MYARATRSVSLVPPAYYADLACERGRCYLHDFLAAGMQRSARSVSGEEKRSVYESAEKYWRNGVNSFWFLMMQSNMLIWQVHANIRDTMFYI